MTTNETIAKLQSELEIAEERTRSAITQFGMHDERSRKANRERFHLKQRLQAATYFDEHTD